MSLEIIPGARCRVNGNYDFSFIHEARKFISRECTIIKITKSGLIQVSLDSNPKMMYSVPKSNIDKL